MSDLGDVLTRLSTGLRINSGKDDPAGLIASELLKSDITATNMAIKNTQRANNVIAIADSALGQVSSLLNDIRGLVNEAANTGAMTSEQIYANQLQVNASLDSIDRISKTTNFQGKLLLDGSLDFATSGVNRYAISNLEIQQANFGSMDAIDIKVNINRAAEPARLYFNQGGVSERTILEVGGVKGSNTFAFQAGTSVVDMANAINAQTDSLGVRAVVGQEATYGQLLATSAGYDNDINFTAVYTGAASGAYSIKYSAGNTDETYYKLTEPTLDVNGNIVKSGEIEFFLKMDKAGYSQNKNLDEEYNNIHTAMLPVGTNTAAQNMVIQSDNGYIIRTFEVVQTTGATTQPSVDFDPVSGHLKILANTGATTNKQIADVINQIDGLQVIQEGSASTLGAAPILKTATTDVRANNSLEIKSLVAGDKYENTDVIFINGGLAPDASTFEYTDAPKNASLTIDNGVTGTGAQFLKLSARGTGTQYNDIAVVFDEPAVSPLAPGEVSVTYDAENKIMHIMGADGNNVTLGKLKEAIEANTPFRADFYNETGLTTKSNLADLAKFTETDSINNDTGDATLKTGQTANSMGTSHQALIVTVGDDTTAQNVVTKFLADPLASKFSIINANGSNGSGNIFLTSDDYTDAALYTEPTIRIYDGALTGATAGSKTNVTAQELMDFVNNDEVLRNIIQADLGLNTPNGNGKLTIFDEYAYYGDPNLETGLQFLGPEGSKPIIFDDGDKTPNQQLDMYFSPDVLGYAQTSIAAQNANAAIQINSRNKGADYDDMVVRYVALDSNATEGYVNYTEGESNSMAYCSIESAGTGTDAETGKFIL
jgi:flagellin-like hook-associated protein FlgL